MRLADAVEVVEFSACAQLPDAPQDVMGLALLRDELLLVVDLAVRLGLKAKSEQSEGQIIVVRTGAMRIGFRVDRVLDMRAFDDASLRTMDDQDSVISGILIDGERICSMIEPKRLIDKSRADQYRRLAPLEKTDQNKQQAETRLFLHVRIQRDNFVVPLDAVHRVVPYSEPDSLKEVDGSGVDGVVSIESDLLPVFDLARLLSLDARQASTVWVVLHGPDGKIAVPVDEACEILTVPVTDIDQQNVGSGAVVTALARVDERVLSVVQPSAIGAAVMEAR